LRETGAIDDFFTVLKTIPNQAPTVAISSPAEGATFTAPAAVPVSASAVDSDGQVVQVDFYANAALLGTRMVAPFSIDWTDVAAGSYALTATATDDKGATVTSSLVNIVVNPPPPAAPTGLTATAGDASVALSWQESSGATSYRIHRATVSGGPYVLIASGVAGTSFNDPAVTNGTTYYYVVTAVNVGGESAPSAEATATPTAPVNPPAAPTGLTATGGNAQVALSWAAASGATSYSAKRATVSGGPYDTLISGLATTNYLDNSASNGTRYYYVVSASNSAGESANSSEASAEPAAPPSAPAAPTNLVATAASRSQINLRWTDNASNETGYLIERSTSSANGFTQIAILGADATTYASTGLKSNRVYYYRVRATNAVGHSPYSNSASAKTLK
jgi:cellulose 1,4-beta-cellobiosidase